MSDEVKLLPCPHEQTSTSHTGDGVEVVTCLECGKHIRIGKLPWPDAEATRPPIGTDEVVERVALALCLAHDTHLAGKSGCAVEAYQAGSPAVAYWDGQARAAIAAMKDAASD